MIPWFLIKSILLKNFKQYWKPIIGGIVLLIYTIGVSNMAKNKANSKCELRESKRIESSLKAQAEANEQAAALKIIQDANIKAAQEKLKQEAIDAENRASEARASEANQRRLNDETSAKLEAAIASKPNGPVALDDGVRDAINRVQNQVRSRRRP